MKDFDQERAERRNSASQRERSFKFGGEIFAYRGDIAFEAFSEFIEDSTTGPTIRLTRLILEAIEDVDGAHDRWKALISRRDDPITMGDVNVLTEWLISEVAGHPTVPPSDSPGSPETPGETSTDDSSSQREPVSAR